MLGIAGIDVGAFEALWDKYPQQPFNLKIQRGYLEDAANEALTCDLRYQGQIEDRESGLYYNLHRYYDADSGQYLSPDPIGMAGGVRPQGYVDNPAEYVDPLGLAKASHGSKEPSKPSMMQKQVERGQAPREIQRVDRGHIPGQEPHIHYKDGTSSNQSGDIHDAHKGTPRPSKKTIQWITGHGWTPPID